MLGPFFSVPLLHEFACHRTEPELLGLLDCQTACNHG
jgi:hypothetical protein